MIKYQPKYILSRLLVVAAAMALLAFAKKADDPIDKLVAALQRWSNNNPQEKVYLHLDKPYYAVGDTIWFKGYVTTGSRHQLSALSGALYVDLINERDSLIRSLKLPVTTGMAMGDIILGDELDEGNYRIRAYTQWMRNAGEAWYFDRTFTVGSVAGDGIVTKADYQYKAIDGKQALTATLNYTDDQGKALADKSVTYRIVIDKNVVWTKSGKTDANGNIIVNIDNAAGTDLTGAYIRTTLDNSRNKEVVKDFPIKAALSQSDVQFFPESGNLLNGVPTRIAFKAVGVDGLGINITGKITEDGSGQEVAGFSTDHAGMGSFLLRPQAGRTYTARISFDDKSTKDISLPKAKDDGYVLSVYQPQKDSLLVRIYTGELQAKQGVNVNLIAQAGGETVFASNIAITKPMTSVWLDKKAFPTGIAQFTLFNSAGEAMNERIAFIKSSDKLELSIKPNKSSYKSKEQVSINLNAKDGIGKATAGNFSVSVIDESKIPSDEANETSIFSSLLLSSDIKGYIEKPNYYFINDDAATDKALDDLMLTQGYRRFVWKEIAKADTTIIKPKFPAEDLGVTISGKVQTLTHKPAPGATVTLLSTRARVTKFATADAEGRFKFDGIFLTDSIKFAVQARTKKGGDKLEVILDKLSEQEMTKNPNPGDLTTNIPGTLKAYIDAGKKQDELNIKMGRMDKVHRLREVNIKGAKTKLNIMATQGMLRIPEGTASRTFYPKESENNANLQVYLSGKLNGVQYRSYKSPEYYPAFVPEVHSYPVLKYDLPAPDKDPQGYIPLPIILNGRLLNFQDAYDVFDNTLVNIDDIIKIEYVVNNPALTAMLANRPAALLIYTKAGGQHTQYTPSIVNTTPKGFNKAREFYSPKYDRPGSAKQLPDMRTTIYWDPYLKTYASGSGNFKFYNGDGPATYRVTVEGINADGQLGRKVFRYTVDGEMAEGATVFPLAGVDSNQKIIATAVDTMRKRMPMEKVYLHTDKSYYNIGDTLWFKAYLTDAELKPSQKSGLLYVELDDDSTEAVKRLALPVKDGIAWGQITLARKHFQEGGYTLRAYTNWMQNFGEDVFFKQRFYIGVPAETAWLVKSEAAINLVDDKDRLDVDIRITYGDRKPIPLRDMEVKIYEGKYYLFKEKMRTGIDGSLKFSKVLKDRLDGRIMRVQITSLDKADNGKRLQVPLTIRRASKIDLQFLPEGGNLVAGLKSTVGFKAIGEDGKGVDIAAEIYDSHGGKLTNINSLHDGMGAFELTPKLNEVYVAKVTKPLVAEKTFTLPKIEAIGTVMHIQNEEQSDAVQVSLAGLDKLPAGQPYYLVATSGERISYSAQVGVNDSKILISKELLPNGVTKVSLVRGRLPINQRLVFIDHRTPLNISVAANKKAYAKRDSVALDIEIKDASGIPVTGNFSLAVTDNSLVRPDTLGDNSIDASLLLNSELKGYIGTPGYYLHRKDKIAWQALDNLLLTQGWTGFDLKNVLSQDKKPAFRAEKKFTLSGEVVNLFGKPVKQAPLLISSQKPSFITTAMTDDHGRFSVSDLPPIDSGSFFIQSKNARGKEMVFGELMLDRTIFPKIPDFNRNAVLPWYVNTDTAQLNYVKRIAQRADFSNMKGLGTMLRNVNVKTAKIIPGSMNPYGPGMSDLAYDQEDIKKSEATTLWQLLRQMMPGIQVMGGTEVIDEKNVFIVMLKYDKYWINRSEAGPLFRKKSNATIYRSTPDLNIDGYSLRVYANSSSKQDLIDGMNAIPLPKLKGVEIMYSTQFTNRSVASGNGLRTPGYRTYDFAKIEITTVQGGGWSTRTKPGTAKYRPLPLFYPKEFYRPKYNVKAPITGEPDYRATLHWEPNLVTDRNGRAKVWFYTSDLPANYTINIQGLSPEGGMGSSVTKLIQTVKAGTN